MSSGNKKYIPVESNPEVFNSYTSKLGVNVAQHAFCDVFGLDEVCGMRSLAHRLRLPCTCMFNGRSAQDTALLLTPLHWDAPQELLAMVPQPVLAVLMLFPVTEASERAKGPGGRAPEGPCMSLPLATITPAVGLQNNETGRSAGSKHTPCQHIPKLMTLPAACVSLRMPVHCVVLAPRLRIIMHGTDPTIDLGFQRNRSDSVRLRTQAERGPKQEAAERDVYFMKQTIGNACGTIALLHAVGNNLDQLSVGAPVYSIQTNPSAGGAWHPGRPSPHLCGHEGHHDISLVTSSRWVAVALYKFRSSQ